VTALELCSVAETFTMEDTLQAEDDSRQWYIEQFATRGTGPPIYNATKQPIDIAAFCTILGSHVDMGEALENYKIMARLGSIFGLK
jgi:hypothetical protein